MLLSVKWANSFHGVVFEEQICSAQLPKYDRSGAASGPSYYGVSCKVLYDARRS